MIIRSLFLIGLASLTLTASAQLDLGVGLAFGTSISNIGFQARGQKAINDTYDGAANLTFFLPEMIDAGFSSSKTSLFTINFDGHYKAINNEGNSLYPLAGINISVVKVKVENEFLGVFGIGSSSSTFTDTNFGLNLGGGGTLSIGEGLQAFGELKYVLSSFDQLVITAGITKTIGAK